MKFAAAIILAVVACAQAGLVPAPSAYSYGLISPYAHYPYAHGYNILPYAAPVHYSAPIVYSAPLAPITYTPGRVSRTELEPSYTAINRGAVHTAALPGHSESVAAVNLEAARGSE